LVENTHRKSRSPHESSSKSYLARAKRKPAGHALSATLFKMFRHGET
jgi:hypothetical protein